MKNIERSSIKFIQENFAKYKNGIILTTSCGATSAIMIDLISKSKVNIPVIFIDTHFLFYETMEFYKVLKATYPKLEFTSLSSKYDKNQFIQNEIIRDINNCCFCNKIEPLNKFISENNIKCWISGLRKVQNEHRNNLQSKEKNDMGIVKIYPILDWTEEDAKNYIDKYNLPKNELFEQGYESIGCYPCTSKSSGREGRWTNSDKTECGLHFKES